MSDEKIELIADNLTEPKDAIEAETTAAPVVQSDSTSSDSEPAPLTSQEINDLKAKAAKADEHWDRMLRLSADFDNFKKRATRERQDAIKFAGESLLQKLIPTLDNFEMAVAAANTPNASAESLRAGVSMIYSQLKNALAEAGLEEIDATGKPFDPTWQEAVSQQESAETPEGHVLQQLRKGYKLRDRLLRPATVVVAKKPASHKSKA